MKTQPRKPRSVWVMVYPGGMLSTYCLSAVGQEPPSRSSAWIEFREVIQRPKKRGSLRK